MLQHHIEALLLTAFAVGVLISVGMLERKHRANYRELVGVLQNTRKELEDSKRAHANDRQRAGILAALLASAAEGIDPSYKVGQKAAETVSYVGIMLDPRLRVRVMNFDEANPSEEEIDARLQQLTNSNMGLQPGQRLAIDILREDGTKIEALAIYAAPDKNFIYRLLDKDVRSYTPEGFDEVAADWLMDSYAG